MALYFITGNKKKFAEVQAVLPHIEQLEMDLPEIQELDAHKIIASKLFEARTALHHGSSFIVEDTSLYFDGLNGLPGPLIKWFLDKLGDKGLYKLAQSFDNFNCSAKTIIGYTDDKGTIEFFEGETRGTIVEPKVEAKFGWDAIFLPEGRSKTYAELSMEEKNQISQRRKAVEKLKTYLG